MISDDIEALIQRLAAEAMLEIEIHVDFALLLAGFPDETIHRRRGQLRYRRRLAQGGKK